MPDFPRYSSERQPTIARPNQASGVANNSSQMLGEATQQSLKAMEDATIKLNNAMVTAEINSFKADKGIFLAGLKNRATLDPDPKNAQKYLKEAQEFSKSALTGMSEQAKRMASLELSTDTQLAQIQIQGIFQQKAIVQAQKDLETTLDEAVKAALNAPYTSSMTKDLSDGYETIDLNVQGGIISPEEGTRRKKEFAEDVRIGSIDQSLYGNPEAFKKNADKYNFKDAKEKSDKLATADKLIAKQQKEIEKAQKKLIDTEEDSLTTMRVNMANNGEPISDVELIQLAKDKMNKGMISPKFAQTYINSLESIKDPKPTKLENVRVYNELKGKQEALKDKEWAWREASYEDRANYRADVLEAYNNGNITEKQMKTFLDKNSDKFMNDPNVRDAVKQVTAQASLYSTPEAKAEVEAEMHFDLMNKIIDGLDPTVALQAVVRERISADLSKTSNKDEFGFEMGQEYRGYIYQGNNKWQKKQ